jgi:hypothetical protein
MTREVAVILALGALAFAAVFVSIASWVLLWGERRERSQPANRHSAVGRDSRPQFPSEPGSPER